MSQKIKLMGCSPAKPIHPHAVSPDLQEHIKQFHPNPPYDVVEVPSPYVVTPTIGPPPMYASYGAVNAGIPQYGT